MRYTCSISINSSIRCIIILELVSYLCPETGLSQSKVNNCQALVTERVAFELLNPYLNRHWLQLCKLFSHDLPFYSEIVTSFLQHSY